MKTFEEMKDKEFACYLCPTVRFLDEHVRSTGCELDTDYRQRLVMADRYCMEPVG
jgi:hypothetical protein